MLGTLAGDMIGSVHELGGTKTTDFPLFVAGSCFTDDTVLTVATMHALLTGTPYDAAYLRFGRTYPYAGYGLSFALWTQSPDPRPYGSWGNGSAMRVSPVGVARDTEEDVLAEARRSAEVTHNHPDGIAGAQATALAVFMARTGATKDAIREAIERRFGYDLQRRIDDVRAVYRWDVSCRGSVPEAILAFLESTSVEGAIRTAVSLGGDADTQAAIAGGIAHAFYGSVPAAIVDEVRRRLAPELLVIADAFERAFPLRPPQ